MADTIQQAGGVITRDVLNAISALGGDTILVHSAWPGAELSRIIAELHDGGISATSGIATALMNRAPDAYKQRRERQAQLNKKPPADVTQSAGSAGDVTQSGKPDGGGQESGNGVTQETQRLRRLRRLNETQRDSTSYTCAEILDSEGEEPADDEKRITRNAAAWFKETVSLPFSQFVVKAWEFNNSKIGLGDWSSPIFWFVYILRGHPEMMALDSQPSKAFKAVEKELTRWTREYRKDGHKPKWGNTGDVWHDWFYHERTDAIAEFSDLWMKIRYRPGHDPLEQAVDESRKLRLLPTKEVAEKRAMVIDQESPRDYTFFLSVAGHLQVAMGDQRIMLPCESLGKLLGVSKMTVSRYARMAIEDGYLVVEKPHQFRSKGGSKATEYRFKVDGWKKLGEKAAPGVKE
jgi:hypothetical protein